MSQEHLFCQKKQPSTIDTDDCAACQAWIEKLPPGHVLLSAISNFDCNMAELYISYITHDHPMTILEYVCVRMHADTCVHCAQALCRVDAGYREEREIGAALALFPVLEEYVNGCDEQLIGKWIRGECPSDDPLLIEHIAHCAICAQSYANHVSGSSVAHGTDSEMLERIEPILSRRMSSNLWELKLVTDEEIVETEVSRVLKKYSDSE